MISPKRCVVLHVHLNIGSNLGDREENIRRAVASLRQLACVYSSVKVSDTVESEPWGYDSSNGFLNVGMSFDTELAPEALLSGVQRVEKSISTASHRDSAGAYIDRLIDIDIIACATTGNDGAPLKLIETATEKLTLPHPRALQRDFVTIPLRNIDTPLYTLLASQNNQSNQ
ncbi:MAG: 2-amino-4-hydroxy-6-hydroxymethyldihydropteridine diphosphokinase [Muribaculaceae bacterium]|nr:2-amino-4-hydroxy-6-hydroxymethyldihydropteridine diphosphokinase [Muribaculaceae bacterium]